ncbi:MAG: ComEC/Rec2 family competence protein [bacterium]
MSIVVGIVFQNSFNTQLVILLLAGIFIIILSLFKRDFLYIFIIILSMANTLLHRPVHIDRLDRAMLFTGNVISEDKRVNYTKLTINLEHIQINNRFIKYGLPVEFYTRLDETMLGKKVQIKGIIKKSYNLHKPNVLTGHVVNIDEQSIFLGNIIYSVRHYILHVLSKLFNPQQCDLAKALILGGSGRIGSDMKDIFSRAGILHILAVSGLHVGFVCAFISAFLFLIPVSTRLKFSAIMVVLILYAGLTGFRPSVCRATIMAFLFGLGLIVQRNVDSIHITNMTALIFLIFRPSLLFDIGAQLSFAAVYGIFTLFPLFNSRIIKRIKFRVLRMMAVPIAISLSAQVFVAPLLIYYFHRLPTMAVITNFLIVPLASVCVCLLFIILTSNAFSIFCAQCVAFLVSQLFTSLMFIARFFANLPFSVLTLQMSPIFIPFCYLLITRKARRWAAYSLITLICLFTLVGFSDCLVIRATPFGILTTTKHGHLFITQKCSCINTARLLSHHQIGELDYLIAPRSYFPTGKKFLEMSDRLHTQYITLGQLLVRIGCNLEIFYRDRQIYKYDFKNDLSSTPQLIQYIVTDGSKTYHFTAPYSCSILDQMIIDVKTAVFKIATLF